MIQGYCGEERGIAWSCFALDIDSPMRRCAWHDAWVLNANRLVQCTYYSICHTRSGPGCLAAELSALATICNSPLQTAELERRDYDKTQVCSYPTRYPDRSWYRVRSVTRLLAWYKGVQIHMSCISPDTVLLPLLRRGTEVPVIKVADTNLQMR